MGVAEDTKSAQLEGMSAPKTPRNRRERRLKRRQETKSKPLEEEDAAPTRLEDPEVSQEGVSIVAAKTTIGAEEEAAVVRRIQLAVLQGIVAGMNGLMKTLLEDPSVGPTAHAVESEESPVAASLDAPSPIASPLSSPRKAVEQPPAVQEICCPVICTPTRLEQIQKGLKDNQDLDGVAKVVREAGGELNPEETALLVKFFANVAQRTLPGMVRGNPTALLEAIHDTKAFDLWEARESVERSAETFQDPLMFHLLDRRADFWGCPAALEFAAHWVAFALKHQPGCFSQLSQAASRNGWTPIHVLTKRLAIRPELLLCVFLRLFPDLSVREFVLRKVQAANPDRTPLDLLQETSKVSRIYLLAAGYAVFLKPQDGNQAAFFFETRDHYKYSNANAPELLNLFWARFKEPRPRGTKSLDHWNSSILDTEFNEDQGVMRCIGSTLSFVNNSIGMPHQKKVEYIVMVMYVVLKCDIHMHLPKLGATMIEKMKELPYEYEPSRRDFAVLHAHLKTALRQKLIYSPKEIVRRLQATVEVAKLVGPNTP